MTDQPVAEPSPETSTATETPAPVDEPGNAVTLHASASLDARIRYARELAAAGTLLPKGVRDGVSPRDVDAIAARTFLMTETGNMLGIHPIAALQGINVIEGKPAIAPALMGALVRRAGHKFRVSTTGTVAGGDIRARAVVTRSDDPEPFEAVWDLERAARAGLCTVAQEGGRTVVRARSSSGKVLPWEAYTEAMLKARATGEVCRDAAEDVLMGAHYTPEELGAAVDAEGAVIDVGHVETLAPQPAAQPAAEPGPEAVAQRIADRWLTASTMADLRAMYAEAPDYVARHSWAGEYSSFKPYAEAMSVRNGEDTTSLWALLAELGAILTAMGGDEGPAGGQGATPPPTRPHAPAGGAEDIVDAEVIDEPAGPAERTRAVRGERGAERVEVLDVDRAADHDPWATGGAGVPTPDEAVATVARGLGGEVLEVEGEDVDPREAQHAARVAAAARAEHDDPAADQGHAGPAVEPEGAGRAAFRQARAEAQARAAAAPRATSARGTRGGQA